LVKRQAEYRRFTEKWHGATQALPWWQRTINIRGTSIHVAGLNSAWMSWQKEDRGKLLVGRYQINQTVWAADARRADFCISLLHHPWGYLREFDARETRALIHQHTDIVLRGHLHATSAEYFVPSDPRRGCIELAAGCLYENSDYPNAFQWIELFPAERAVQVHFRAWIHTAGTSIGTSPAVQTGPQGSSTSAAAALRLLRPLRLLRHRKPSRSLLRRLQRTEAAQQAQSPRLRRKKP
jgi:hypothetical protein